MNLAHIVEPHPDDAPALVEGSNHITYGELRRRVAIARGGLAAAGIGPGRRVAMLLPTSVEFVVAYLAILGSGAAAAPLNPQSPAPELDRELAVLHASLLIGELPAGGELDEARSRLRQLCVADLEGHDPAPIVDVGDDDPAALLFTSGTAGFPKAAVLTHRSMQANLDQMRQRAGMATAEDVGILMIPPFHVFGLNGVLGVDLSVGAATVLVERFDAAATLGLIREEHVTVVAAVPSVFAAWAGLAGAGGDEMAGVRLAISGAAALDEVTATRFSERFGIPVWQGYGLTEASCAVAFPDVTASEGDPSSIGSPLPGIEVRLVDDYGEEVDPGDPGELLVRGPNVFAGYFEDRAASAKVLDRAGWLHTGDVAVMGEDASLTLVDRRKDLIIVSGFNVYPAEVENVLREHPDVAEVAVTGVPDAAQGEAVCACVVPAEGCWPEGEHLPVSPTKADLVAFAAERLARYKCPTRVTFVRRLPRGLAGEPLRRALNEILSA